MLLDDFSGPAVDPEAWSTYSGPPGGDPGGWFDPTHVTTVGGALVISAFRDPADGGLWASGGISSAPSLSQTYGKYLVRMRFAGGRGISHAVLLVPSNGSWPPEIDFSEDNGENRAVDYATLHHGAQNAMEQLSVATDLTQWHTFGVEWTREKLIYTIDGHEWAHMTGSDVPAVPMVLDIQTQGWACGTNAWEACPDLSTPTDVDLDVDWVVAYAPTG